MTSDLGVLALLTEAQRRGLLGPASLDDQIAHSLAFARLVRATIAAEREDLDGAVVIDLGTGGGLPGLIVAHELPGTRVVFLEGSTKRAAWLQEATSELFAARDAGIHPDSIAGDRRDAFPAAAPEVLAERAEVVGRSVEWRASASVITARLFGAPAVVAECAAPLLRAGGRLIVSEPPGDSVDRWPETGLAQLGLGAADLVDQDGRSFAVMRLEKACPDRYPRRLGVPAKRPLW